MMKPTYMELDTSFRWYDGKKRTSALPHHSGGSRNPVLNAFFGMLIALSLFAPSAYASDPLPPDTVYKVSASADAQGSANAAGGRMPGAAPPSSSAK